MSDEIKKSGYGPKGWNLYDPVKNIERKKNNVGDTGEGSNRNVKSYGSKPGRLSAKQQAAQENSLSRVKALSGPVKTLTPEEISRLDIKPPKMKKDEDMLEVAPDGKQELVEGKEPLKKDPLARRWKKLKKALDHEKAFMSMEDELESDPPADEEEQQPEQGEEEGDEAAQSPSEEEGDPSEQPEQSQQQQEQPL